MWTKEQFQHAAIIKSQQPPLSLTTFGDAADTINTIMQGENPWDNVAAALISGNTVEGLLVNLQSTKARAQWLIKALTRANNGVPVTAADLDAFIALAATVGVTL